MAGLGSGSFLLSSPGNISTFVPISDFLTVHPRHAHAGQTEQTARQMRIEITSKLCDQRHRNQKTMKFLIVLREFCNALLKCFA